jgi:IrrE N-terminal-like domain
MKKSNKRVVSYTRQQTVMEKAAALRKVFASDDQKIDLISLIEGGMRKYLPKYDWIVGDDSHFDGIEDGEAYVDFSQEPLLVLRDSIYAALFEVGSIRSFQAGFVVAHEIGHVALHSRSRKILPRRKVGSGEQYTHNPKLEREASIFAGSLLVPTTTFAIGMDANSIAIRYGISQSAAEVCVGECADYTRIKRLRRLAYE